MADPHQAIDNISPSNQPSATGGGAAPRLTSNRSSSIPKYGTLNSQPYLYYLTGLSPAQLHFITQTAPDHTRRNISNTESTQVLLDEVFRLRQLEADERTINKTSNAELAQNLSRLSSAEIIQLSQQNPTHLPRLMNAALSIDNTLRPSQLPDDNTLCATYAISWKLVSVQQLLRPISAPRLTNQPIVLNNPTNNEAIGQLQPSSQPANPTSLLLQQLFQDDPPPPHPCLHIEASEEGDGDYEPPTKKQK